MAVIQVPQPAIRNITLRAMMNRFTLAERIAIRAFIADTDNVSGTREVVEDAFEDLRSSPNTQLDLPEVAAGLDGLVSLGLLAAGRPAELLVDGTKSEQFGD